MERIIVRRVDGDGVNLVEARQHAILVQAPCDGRGLFSGPEEIGQREQGHFGELCQRVAGHDKRNVGDPVDDQFVLLHRTAAQRAAPEVLKFHVVADVFRNRIHPRFHDDLDGRRFRGRKRRDADGIGRSGGLRAEGQKPGNRGYRRYCSNHQFSPGFEVFLGIVSSDRARTRGTR